MILRHRCDTPDRRAASDTGKRREITGARGGAGRRSGVADEFGGRADVVVDLNVVRARVGKAIDGVDADDRGRRHHAPAQLRRRQIGSRGEGSRSERLGTRCRGRVRAAAIPVEILRHAPRLEFQAAVGEEERLAGLQVVGGRPSRGRRDERYRHGQHRSDHDQDDRHDQQESALAPAAIHQKFLGCIVARKVSLTSLSCTLTRTVT